MRNPDVRTMALILGLSAMLGGCGGGDGGGGDGGGGGGAIAATTTTPDSNGIPASALQSIDSFVDFLKGLLAQASEAAEPIALGNAALPTSETAEPVSLN